MSTNIKRVAGNYGNGAEQQQNTFDQGLDTFGIGQEIHIIGLGIRQANPACVIHIKLPPWDITMRKLLPK